MLHREEKKYYQRTYMQLQCYTQYTRKTNKGPNIDSCGIPM